MTSREGDREGGAPSLVQEIRAFVISAFYAPPDISDEAPLLEMGIIDSTGLLEVIAFIEETYAVRINDGDLRPENFGSIAKMAAYLGGLLDDGVPTLRAPRAASDARGGSGARGGPPRALD